MPDIAKFSQVIAFHKILLQQSPNFFWETLVNGYKPRIQMAVEMFVCAVYLDT